MDRRIQFAAALFLILASVPLAQALEDCAEYLVISYNQQKMIQSLYFNTGNPSTITVKSLKSDSYHFWFPKDHNSSSTFDVVVYEPYGYLKQGQIMFREPEELKWYVKEDSGTIYYNCSAEGKGMTDWFTFQFFKDKQIQLSDGSTITANVSLVTSNNATNAFTFPDETIGSEFLILTQNIVKQSLTNYKAGTVLFKTPKGYTVISTPDNYPRVQYVGCCATRLAPTAIPTPSPIPSPSLIASPTQVPTATSTPVVSQAPSPTPSSQPELQFDFTGIALGAVVLIALIALAFFAFKPAKKK